MVMFLTPWTEMQRVMSFCQSEKNPSAGPRCWCASSGMARGRLGPAARPGLLGPPIWDASLGLGARQLGPAPVGRPPRWPAENRRRRRTLKRLGFPDGPAAAILLLTFMLLPPCSCVGQLGEAKDGWMPGINMLGTEVSGFHTNWLCVF